MRNLFVMLLTGALAATISHAQDKQPKQPNPEKDFADAIKNIKEKDKPDVRNQAAMDLDEFGRKAAFALGRLAGDPEKTIAVLIAAFKDENEDVRNAAGDALAKFGKDAVPPLLEVLKSDNANARLRAATSLGEIGSDAKDAI